MRQTVVEKIARAHMTEGPERALRPGDMITLRPRHAMTHDNTAAVMKKFAALGAPRIHDPRQIVFTLDHDIQNRSDENLAKYAAIERFAREHGIDFHPAGAGIGHQIMVQDGYALPGALVVASDSHSNMYGAVGALGTPVVRTDAAAIWATGEFWWQIPRTVQVVLHGRLRPGATGKDVIVTLCGLYNQGEVLNAAVEFGGAGVAALTMDERMAIANMTTEWGALVGWFPVDEKTLAYLRRRRQVLAARGIERLADEDLERWLADPPAPDPDAAYHARIDLDLAKISPHVSGPDTVQVMRSLAEIEKDRVAIDKAYLVSCVNSRVEDLVAAAAVVANKKVAPRVSFYVSAASKEVEDEAKALGAWQRLVAAGATVLPPGCGPCIGLGAGVLEPGEVGISATNRNFKGRMGSRDAKAYLASPQVVAASAVAGYITGPAPSDGMRPERRYVELAPAPAGDAGEVEIMEGFPRRVSGRLVFLPQDNLDTDGIYGKDYTYREGMTRAEMAAAALENYDPEFGRLAASGDVLVSGFNFGTGSSREQAVTALKCKGIPMVIAGSFSQTYLRNAYNNGFSCIECPALAKRLAEMFASDIDAGERTIVPGGLIEVDFADSTARFRGEVFSFPPLGAVPQSLVAAGGIENLIRTRLGARS